MRLVSTVGLALLRVTSGLKRDAMVRTLINRTNSARVAPANQLVSRP